MAELSTVSVVLKDVGVDEEWLDYVASELIDGLSTIKSHQNVFRVIGPALIDALSCDEATARTHCASIFSALLSHQLIILDNAKGDLDEEEEKEDEEEDIDDEDEQSRIVGEGECELCEREMPLTKHHLIPREVHEWYKKHEGKTKEELHTGVMLCRPCHSAVHKMEDNKTLARDYNTLAKLLAHEKMPKWIAYIRKQPPSSKADKRTLKPNGPRDLPPSYDDD